MKQKYAKGEDLLHITLLISVLCFLCACSHTPTERETYAQGIHEGFSMGHAPQILPIQITPVSLNAPAVQAAPQKFSNLDAFMANQVQQSVMPVEKSWNEEQYAPFVFPAVGE